MTKEVKHVSGQKILKSGKLGATYIFDSVKDAALKVGKGRNLVTVESSIRHAANGDQKSAYGYVWSYNI